MRIIKLAVISFIILFLFVTAISLLLPSHVRISKAINIKTVADSVWNQLDDLRKWESWNPFFSGLGTKKVTWLDTAGGTLNAIKVETTTIRWKEKNGDEHIAEMLSGGRLPVMSGWKCIISKQGDSYAEADSITVQWYMDFRLRWYPWEKFASLMFEKSYGAKMEQGLTNLKGLLEK
jgi:Polyketide cyclase / dehydrase and lipid transport